MLFLSIHQQARPGIRNKLKEWTPQHHSFVFGLGTFSYAFGLGGRLCFSPGFFPRPRPRPWCEWPHAGTFLSPSLFPLSATESESESDDDESDDDESDDSSLDSSAVLGLWYMQQTGSHVSNGWHRPPGLVHRRNRCRPLELLRPRPSLSTTSSTHCTDLPLAWLAPLSRSVLGVSVRRSGSAALCVVVCEAVGAACWLCLSVMARSRVFPFVASCVQRVSVGEHAKLE